MEAQTFSQSASQVSSIPGEQSSGAGLPNDEGAWSDTEDEESVIDRATLPTRIKMVKPKSGLSRKRLFVIHRHFYYHADGPRGHPGKDGEKGDPGKDGEKGDPGKDGEKGDPGKDGKEGARGPAAQTPRIASSGRWRSSHSTYTRRALVFSHMFQGLLSRLIDPGESSTIFRYWRPRPLDAWRATPSDPTEPTFVHVWRAHNRAEFMRARGTISRSLLSLGQFTAFPGDVFDNIRLHLFNGAMALVLDVPPGNYDIYANYCGEFESEQDIPGCTQYFVLATNRDANIVVVDKQSEGALALDPTPWYVLFGFRMLAVAIFFCIPFLDAFWIGYKYPEHLQGVTLGILALQVVNEVFFRLRWVDLLCTYTCVATGNILLSLRLPEK